MADGNVTSDQIGSGDTNTYGADIAPSGGQDMFAYDGIVGSFPSQERDDPPGSFTGGKGPGGIGGEAEGMAPGGVSPTGGVPGSLYERKGF